MGLSDIAAGLEVTTEQRERGVAAVDGTAADLAAALFDASLELTFESSGLLDGVV